MGLDYLNALSFCGLEFSQLRSMFSNMNIENLKTMLTNGQDSLILRFGLGQALIKAKEFDEAIQHLLKALEFDAEYSAAYKLLGKAYAQTEQNKLAIETYEKGVEIAERKGDIQAAKEMKVFLKRLLKN